MRWMLVLVLTAGCGGSAAAQTVTHTQTITVAKAPAACKAMAFDLNTADRLMLQAGRISNALILPAYKAGLYGSSIAGILAREDTARRLVEQSTAKTDAATGLVGACFG